MSKASPRKQPKQQRSKATVAAIVEATAQLLVDEGFHNISTNRIAEVAGVSVGSLYQYFPNKESVVAAVIDEFADRQFVLLAEELAEMDPEGSLEAAVLKVVRAMLEAKRQEPELSRVLFQELPPMGQIDVMREWTRRAMEIVQIAFALRPEELRPLNAELASFVLITACHGIIHTTVVDRPELLENDELAQETAQLILRYIKAE